MAISIIFSRMILACMLLKQWQIIHTCDTKHISNLIAEYRCAPRSTSDSDIWKTNLPRCVWKCLSVSACLYINHNQTGDQCILGFGACKRLEPAPGFLIQAFGPARDACLSWGSPDEPGRVPVQMHDGHETVYVARVLRSNALIPGKYATSGNGFWCSIEGDATGPINLEDVSVLTTDPACTLPLMPYTSGAPIPPGAVIGGHLADGTNLYVMYVEDGSKQPAYGYYNPSSRVAHWEMHGSQTTTTMLLLILLWERLCVYIQLLLFP